jgi:hypothetical protein
MTMPNIPSELFTTFNDVTYFDEPHKYYLNDKPLTSVTTLIHRYVEEFDEEYWSEKKGKEFGIPQDEIKHAWTFINERATTKGSAIHDYAENRFLNKVFPYPKNDIIKKFGYDPVKYEYDLTKIMVDNFIKATKGKLIPIRTEMIIYDKDNMIGGMLDLLVWNIKEQEFQIWDYKTNKEFEFESDRNLDGKLFLLQDSDLEKYSIQLSAYKYIIEKNTGIKLGKSYLVWFSYKNNDYEIIEAKNREYYVKEIFEDNKVYSLI